MRISQDLNIEPPKHSGSGLGLYRPVLYHGKGGPAHGFWKILPSAARVHLGVTDAWTHAVRHRAHK